MLVAIKAGALPYSPVSGGDFVAISGILRRLSRGKPSVLTGSFVGNFVEIGFYVVDGDFVSLIAGYNEANLGDLAVRRMLAPDVEVTKGEQPGRRYGRSVSVVHVSRYKYAV